MNPNLMNPIRSLLFSSSACGVAAALLTGCGGGGGGGNGASPTPTPSSGPVTLLRDDFSGSALSGNTWGVYAQDQRLQRTKFGFTPDIVSENGDSFARLRLDSFNPNSVGDFKGTEIFTKRRFARGNGLEMTAKLRAPGLPAGLILAFFGIHDNNVDSDGPTYRKDEIDFEILTAQQEQFAANTRNRLYLNIWNDWNLRDQFDENDANDTTRIHDDKTYGPAKATGYDYANWNIYTVRWYPDRTEFYVNGTLERVETEVKPDEDLSIHFNMWTGITDFRQAYSASLQPASSAADNKTYTFDVDYVAITDISGGTSARTATKFTVPPTAGLKSYRSR